HADMPLRKRRRRCNHDNFSQAGNRKGTNSLPCWPLMRSEYDPSEMKSRLKPYAPKLKEPITMRLGEDVLEYFKGMTEETGVPYQTLINLYLRDCMTHGRKIDINWQ